MTPQGPKNLDHKDLQTEGKSDAHDHQSHGHKEHVHGPDCGHDHNHDAHSHAGHVHGPDCGHDHSSPERARHAFTPTELNAVKAMSELELSHEIVGYIDKELYGKAVVLQEVLIEKTDETDWSKMLSRQYQLALAYSEIAEYQNAAELWDEIIDSLVTIDEPYIQCEANSNAAKTAMHLNDFENARSYYETVLNIAEAQEQDIWEATALHGLGEIEMRDANFDYAKKLFQESLDIRIEIGDKFGLVESTIKLADIRLMQQEFVSAKALLEEALKVAKTEQGLESERAVIEAALSKINKDNLKSKLSGLKTP